MKKLKFLILILSLFIGIKSISASHNFDNTIKVYDYAQVLSDKEENKLKKNVDKYIDKYNFDMVIVTVKYYQQATLENYMNLFYTQNNFGKGNNKDGIIVVLDLKNNNDVGINVYGKTINFYSEDEINNIVNKLKKENNYYKKLSKFIEYSNEYIEKTNINYNDISDESNYINWLNIIVLSLIMPTIIIMIGLLKNKNVKKEETANYYIKKDSIVINTKTDKFITTNTKKKRINNKYDTIKKGKKMYEKE